jgi:hypothetical protein
MALLFLAAVALLTYRLVANLGALSHEPRVTAPSSAELAPGKDER